ncbi:MAG: hypothetical protein LQ352_000474 [Teloschistes flavicans]|nr:MAG: hypothetical protein LQ352_000474 [Teloschistes flavicans]
MTVSDGTWDTTRNTFLLPNLVGLNFATMRYNGMGNRFREFNNYHTLILAHGVMAALTFLLFIPSAIMLMRFKRHHQNALRYHAWLQILAFLVATAVIILGFIAVGPKRSLSNPHHGIGLALYVMIVFQFFGGAWLRHKLRKKRPSHGLLRSLLHHWLGRTIALLGIAQVALGITLYGSPKALFVLYALAVFVLILTYFILTYRDDKYGGSDYDDRYSYSYGSGSVVDDRRHHGNGISNLVKAGAAGVGIAALTSRFRNRSRSRPRGEPEVVGSRRHSLDDTADEKYSQYGRDPGREGGWRDRLLKVGAVAGAAGLANKYFGRHRHRDEDSDVGDYGPPLGGATAINPDPMERVEEGRPMPSNHHPLNQPLNHRRSTSSISYTSYSSASREDRGHGLRNAVAGLGAFGLARSIFKGRRERKEQKRMDAIREQERRDRIDNRHLTGDGFPRRGGRRGSLTTSTVTDPTGGRPHHDPGLPPPIPAGTFPVAAGVAGATAAGHSRDRFQPGVPPSANIPPPPRDPVVAPVSMPPIPPDPQGGLFHHESSASSADGRRHRRRRSGRNSVAAAGVAGLAAAEASNNRDRRHSAGVGEGSPASPPVSVKVKLHNDGRHVTLRRLPEEEAAAERAARRKDRQGRRRGDSASSLSGPGSSGERWRRTEALERQQAEQMRVESERLAAARNPAQNQPFPAHVPPPPPIPGSATGPTPPAGSVSSPGHYDTEASAEYANNRRRRRAERAQAREARAAAGGNSVEFT